MEQEQPNWNKENPELEPGTPVQIWRAEKDQETPVVGTYLGIYPIDDFDIEAELVEAGYISLDQPVAHLELRDGTLILGTECRFEAVAH